MNQDYTIWHDATIITMRDPTQWEVICDAAIVIKNDKIVWVGKQETIPLSYTASATLESAKQALITPGLIDCHTHIVYAHHRAQEFIQRLKGLSYEEIIQQGGGIYSTVAATETASMEDLYHQSKQRLIALMQEGVTTLEIKSGYGLTLATERKILQVARQLGQDLPIDIQTTFLGPHVLPKAFSSAEVYIAYLCTEVLPNLLKDKLIDGVDGFCDKIAFSEHELEPFFQFAQQHQLNIKVHAEQLSLSGGAALAARFHALSADHLEYIDEQGIQALQKAGCVAVLLPGANYFMQQKIKPPIARFRECHIPMAIATDSNPGTCPTTSLLLMMNMACVLFELTPFEALQGVTSHAAKALGLQAHKGILAPDMDADFVVWDIDCPEELAYRFGSNPCLCVVKKGKRVYDRSSPF